MARPRIDPHQRFWSKVDIKSLDECWPWKSQLDKNGYGRFRPGGRENPPLAAHRWILYQFGMNKNLIACHACDNPSCVNPLHLFAGTHKDNSQDMVKKQRHFNQVKTKLMGVKSINGRRFKNNKRLSI